MKDKKPVNIEGIGDGEFQPGIGCLFFPTDHRKPYYGTKNAILKVIVNKM